MIKDVSFTTASIGTRTLVILSDTRIHGRRKDHSWPLTRQWSPAQADTRNVYLLPDVQHWTKPLRGRARASSSSACQDNCNRDTRAVT